MNDIITQSAASTFRACELRYRLRYVDGLAPAETHPALAFGSAWHEVRAAGLRRFAETGDAQAAVAAAVYALNCHPLVRDSARDDSARETYAKLSAAVRAYARRWWGEPQFGEEELSDRAFDVIEIEAPFEHELRPGTPWSWRGLVDDVRRRHSDNSLWICEAKTAGQVDGGYLERLWSDAQIHTYAAAIERTYGEAVAGVIYDVLVKPRLRLKPGESREDFEARVAALKTVAARDKNRANGPRQAETDDEYAARLDEHYARPDSLVRVELILDRGEVASALDDLAEVGHRILDRRERAGWLRNTDACYAPGRSPCAFRALCRQLRGPLTVPGEHELAVYGLTRRGPHAELVRSGRFKDLAAPAGDGVAYETETEDPPF